MGFVCCNKFETGIKKKIQNCTKVNWNVFVKRPFSFIERMFGSNNNYYFQVYILKTVKLPFNKLLICLCTNKSFLSSHCDENDHCYYLTNLMTKYTKERCYLS